MRHLLTRNGSTERPWASGAWFSCINYDMSLVVPARLPRGGFWKTNHYVRASNIRARETVQMHCNCRGTGFLGLTLARTLEAELCEVILFARRRCSFSFSGPGRRTADSLRKAHTLARIDDVRPLVRAHRRARCFSLASTPTCNILNDIPASSLNLSIR